MADTRIETLLQALDNAFDGVGWQGATLESALRDVTPEQAVWRFHDGEHTIWEHLLHAAYWKHTARRYLLDLREEDFPCTPPNWPETSAGATADDLKRDRAFLDYTHSRLRDAVAAFDSARLDVRPVEGTPTFAELIVGVAAHDTHHTGQIQLLKRIHARHG